MNFKSNSSIYNADYFYKYNKYKPSSMTSITEDVMSEALTGNKLLDIIYDILINYTSFLHNVNDINKRTELFTKISDFSLIKSLTKYHDNLYILNTGDFLDVNIEQKDINPILNDYFYDAAIGNKSTEEIEPLVETTNTLCKIIEDLIVKKIDDYYHEVIYIYINLVSVNKDEKAIHIIIFEPEEENPSLQG